MKRLTFTEAHLAFTLHPTDTGASVEEVFRKADVVGMNKPHRVRQLV